jgi:hypothetical protein
VGSLDSCLYAEIRTRISDTISLDYHFEHSGISSLTFTVKVLLIYEKNILCLINTIEEVIYIYIYRERERLATVLP